MKIDYNVFKQKRDYTITLCQPNGEEMYSLPILQDRILTLNLNDLSEFTCTLPYVEETKPYYDEVKVRKLIRIEDIGIFTVQEVTEDIDGIVRQKNITAKSLEFELSNKNIDIEDGTYRLYNSMSTSDTVKPTIMDIVFSYVPNWSIGHVDSDLFDTYRTFELKDNNLYNFLKQECQEAYDCVFTFDTIKREINIYKTVTKTL